MPTTKSILAAVAASLPADRLRRRARRRRVGFGSYALVRARETAVGNDSLRVTPPREWNRQRGQLFIDIREVEDWTLNGPLLDGISFVTGLKSQRHAWSARRAATTARCPSIAPT